MKGEHWLTSFSGLLENEHTLASNVFPLSSWKKIDWSHGSVMGDRVMFREVVGEIAVTFVPVEFEL